MAGNVRDRRRCRCAPPARRPACSTAGPRSARATAPACPGPDDGLPPVPLPTVPLPDDQAAPTRHAGRHAARAAGRHHAVPLRAAGAGRQRRPRRSRGHRRPDGRGRGHGPVRRRARRAGQGGRLRHRVGPGGHAGRGRARRPARPASTPCRPTRPSSPPCSTAARSPWSRSTSSPTPASPGPSRPTRAPSRSARAAALQRIDERSAGCGPRWRRRDDDTLVLLAGISEVNDGRPQLHVGMASGPGLRRRPAG